MVLIIGKKGCQTCQSAKESLNRLKVPFLYIDINQVPLATKRHLVFLRQEKGIELSYPIILTYNQQGDIKTGFNPEDYEHKE